MPHPRLGRRRRTARHALSVEARFILLSAGASDVDGRLRDMLPAVRDWQRFFDLAIAEGAEPVLGRRIRSLEVELDPRVDFALRHIGRAAALRQTHLRRRLMDVLDSLSSAGIPVVLLKGCAMAHGTYRFFDERPMSDIDLLLERGRAAEAWALLRSAGWISRLREEFDPIYETMHHLPPLIDATAPSLRVGLELHTDIIQPGRNPFRFTAADLWRGAIRVDDLPAGTFIPEHAHLFLHCCLHFGWSHMMRGAAWRTFRDIGALTREPSFDWRAAVELARRTGSESVCYWTLRLARSIAALPVPEDALASLEPRLPNPLLDVLERHFGPGVLETEQLCPSEGLRGLIWQASMISTTDRSFDGSTPRFDDRPWHVLHSEAGPISTGDVESGRTRATSPSAWLRYVKSLAWGGGQ